MLSILYGVTGAMQAQVYEWAAFHANQGYLEAVYHGAIVSVISIGQMFS